MVVAGSRYGRCVRCGKNKHLTEHHIPPSHTKPTKQIVVYICKSCHEYVHRNNNPRTRKWLTIDPDVKYGSITEIFYAEKLKAMGVSEVKLCYGIGWLDCGFWREPGTCANKNRCRCQNG